jgi:hypothetical protein
MVDESTWLLPMKQLQHGRGQQQQQRRGHEVLKMEPIATHPLPLFNP